MLCGTLDTKAKASMISRVGTAYWEGAFPLEHVYPRGKLGVTVKVLGAVLELPHLQAMDCFARERKLGLDWGEVTHWYPHISRGGWLLFLG